jgi:hypothetical protein
MGYGSALPYIGRALAGGLQSGQETIRSGLQDYEAQQKIADMKRQQEQRMAQEQLLGGITDPRERLLATLAPTEYVKGQFAAPKEKAKLLTPEEQASAGLPSVGRYQQKADGTYDLVQGTAPKEQTSTDLDRLIARRDEIKAKNPNDPSLKIYDDKIRKETQFAPPSTVIMSPRQIFQDEQALRKEYTAIPEVKIFGEVQNAYDTIKTSLGKQSPAGDLAGATKFMKLLDPGSVVRESELGMAMAATGAIDRAQNYFKMLQTGQKLSPDQRKDFLDLSTKLYSAAEGRKASYDQQYGSIAEQNQLSPSNVVKGFKKQGEWSIKEKR